MSLYDEEIRKFERKLLMDTLLRFRCRQQKAADFLGMHRNSLTRKMKSCGFTLAEVRAEYKRIARQVGAA